MDETKATCEDCKDWISASLLSGNKKEQTMKDDEEQEITIEQLEQEPAQALTGRGGAGRGQGRHFHDSPIERLISIRLTLEDEEYYRLILEMTTPKTRFALLVLLAKLLQADLDRERIQSVKAKRRYATEMLEDAAERLRAEADRKFLADAKAQKND